MEVGLLHVRVERVARIGHIEQPRGDAGGDQRRHALEIAGQAAALSVVDGRAVTACRLAYESELCSAFCAVVARNSSVVLEPGLA